MEIIIGIGALALIVFLAIMVDRPSDILSDDREDGIQTLLGVVHPDNKENK